MRLPGDRHERCRGQILNLPREDYVGHAASELGSDLTPVLEDASEVLRTGKYVEGHINLERTERRYLQYILYSPCAGEVVAFFSDQTEVHKAHEVLYRNERFLRNIFDNIQVGVELYDPDGRLVDINNKDMEIFGVTKEQAVGLSFYDHPLVPQEIRDAVRAGKEQRSDRLSLRPARRLLQFVENRIPGDLHYGQHAVRHRGEHLQFHADKHRQHRDQPRPHAAGGVREFVCTGEPAGQDGFLPLRPAETGGQRGAPVVPEPREEPDTPLNQILGVYNHVDPVDKAAILENIGRVKAGTVRTASTSTCIS